MGGKANGGRRMALSPRCSRVSRASGPALLLGMLADKAMEVGLLKAKITALQRLLLDQRIDSLFQ